MRPRPSRTLFGLEHVCIHGRITGVVDGDAINVLILGKQQIRVRIAFILTRRKKVSRSVSAPRQP